MNMLGGKLRAPASADDAIKRWFDELGRGIEKRDMFIEEWEKNEEYAFRDLDTPVMEDSTQVNKLGSWIEARTAALAYRNPRAKYTPRNPAGWEPVQVPVIDPQSGPIQDPVVDPMTGQPAIDPMTGQPLMQPRMRQIPRYKVREHTINYLLGRPGFRAAAEGRLGIKAAQLHGIGCFKVGYTADFDAPDEEAPPLSAEMIPFTPAEALEEKYEVSEDGTPMIDAQGMVVPKGRIPVGEQWFIDWCDTKRMIFDPDGENNFAKHRWVAYEYVKTLGEVKADPYFQNTDDIRATGTGQDSLHDSKSVVDSFFNSGSKGTEYRKRDKLVRLFEIWDKEHRRLLVLADGHDKPLRNDEFPEGVDPSTGPWAFYRPIERLGDWYGHEPASDLRILNAWYNQANKQSMHEMRKSPPKTLVDAEAVDGKALEAITSPLREVVKIDRKNYPNAPLDSFVRNLDFPTIMPEMFNYSKIIAANFDEVAGQPGESRGVASADTATQVMQLSSRETMREDYQRGIYAETWLDILKKLDDSVQANMTIEQAVTINDGDGYAFVTMVTPEMIQCDCDIELDVEDMAPRDKQADKANFVQAMTVASQAPWLVMNEMGAAEFFDMFGVHNQILAKSISQGAQLQMQLAAAGAQGKQSGKPNNDPPRDEATAISQEGR